MRPAPSVELRILDERIRAWGLPQYHSEMAAGVDLFACIDAPVALEPQAAALLIPAGIAVHIGDASIAGIIVPRSGLGHRSGVVLGNLVGVLDADYTGPLLISTWNRSPLGSAPIVINPGDRIAHLLSVPVLRPVLRSSRRSRTTRSGGGGFGSTGHGVPSGKP